MFYTWPLKKLKTTHPRLGTLGEFRGLGTGDGVTVLHSGTDLAEFGGNLPVYSPDTGLVRRLTRGIGGNPSAGTGPIRVGHFAFNHINNINAKPHSEYIGRNNNRIQIHKDLPIYVVEPGKNLFTPKRGVANPQKDADFKARKVKKNPVSLLGGSYARIGADNYRNATVWPRTVPIGRGVGPTDLHCIYYESADGSYLDLDNIANCLEVWENYKNEKKPRAMNLRLHAQVGDAFILDFDSTGNKPPIPPGGATLKVKAFSNFNSLCGIYQLEYRISGEPPFDTGRLNMWRFHKPPPDAKAFVLVDDQLSKFNTVTNKFTYYAFTKSRNENIDDSHHWEVENTTAWPDGHYFISVWLKNIKKSQGVGVDPAVHEREYRAELDLGTVRVPSRGEHRTVRVTKKFKKV